MESSTLVVSAATPTLVGLVMREDDERPSGFDEIHQ